MLFALRVPYTKVCKDGLMMVNWPKHVAKVKKNNILLSLTNQKMFCCLLVFTKCTLILYDLVYS